jgi:hypothetical protein
MRTRRKMNQALLPLWLSLIFVPHSHAHGGDRNLIHACINNEGIVRIVGPNDECAKSETARHWIRVRQGDKPARDRELSGTKLTSQSPLLRAVPPIDEAKHWTYSVTPKPRTEPFRPDLR